MASLAPAVGDLATPDMERPVPASQRIEALDFIRGAALFGILLMNITAFGLPEAYLNPTNSGGAEGVNLWTWIFTQVGFEGTQRGLFSLLFGAGVILFTARLEAAGRADTADLYYRRNLWLIGFGLVNSFVFLWPGDILYTYGITALFLYPFRRLAAKWLLMIGASALLLGALWNLHDASVLIKKHDAYQAASSRADGVAPTKEQEKAIESWKEARADFEVSSEKVAEKIAARTGGYWSALQSVAESNTWWQSYGLYRYFSDVFGMMLIGMALFKLGVLTLDRPLHFYVSLIVIGYGIGLAVNIWETRTIIEGGFSAISFARTNITYDLGRLPMTMGHLGLLLLFVRSGIFAWFRHSLSAVGRMALTSYLTHSVVCGIIFIGFGLYGTLERHELYYTVFLIWAVQLAISPLWLRHYRFGPVEWLWRYLTYLRRPPLRRTPANNPAPAAL